LIEITRLSLGSWRSFDRIPTDQGAALLREAFDRGIRVFDTARYDDETGHAPIPSGYSEVAFGEAFRAAGLPRTEVAISTKLWWEFWPDQTPRAELEASLERTGFDAFDLVYSDPPPAVLPLEDVVASLGELLADGKAEAWGVVNWPAGPIAQAAALAAARGLPPMRLVQLAYNLVRRSPVEDAEMIAAVRRAGAGIVASAVLAGGVFSGKYADPGERGRVSEDDLASPRVAPAVALVPQLVALADELDTTPAALAIAFTLSGPQVETALLGATRPDQISANARALGVADALTADQLARLRALGGA
jgi:aryl-alcohol dehydrogenase-like predicted oxidoreductase